MKYRNIIYILYLNNANETFFLWYHLCGTGLRSSKGMLVLVQWYTAWHPAYQTKPVNFEQEAHGGQYMATSTWLILPVTRPYFVSLAAFKSFVLKCFIMICTSGVTFYYSVTVIQVNCETVARQFLRPFVNSSKTAILWKRGAVSNLPLPSQCNLSILGCTFRVIQYFLSEERED